MQFCFGHGALEPEDELVVEIGRVIDTVGVGDQGVGDRRTNPAADMTKAAALDGRIVELSCGAGLLMYCRTSRLISHARARGSNGLN